jgi:multimeric flavodoxin WrbA
MQYVLFLQKKFPEHELRIVNVCQDIKRLEEDAAAFHELIDAIQASAAVLWATPVYVLLVPGPYKRFIELIFARSAQSAFRQKYAATLTTSVRFFDNTAHNYLHAICDDLGMRFVGAYSAEMYDLLKVEERNRLVYFWKNFLRAVEDGRPTQRSYGSISPATLNYEPGEVAGEISSRDRRILIIADADEDDTNMRRMVGRFAAYFTQPPEVIHLHDVRIRGGCLGCVHCSFDNVCVYGDADDVCEIYRKMAAADVVIQAGSIKDRFLSARWKTFVDRGFFNNHVPILAGKQIGFLVSGPLTQLPELRGILEAFAEIGATNLIGIVSDECRDSQELDRLLETLARRAMEYCEAGYVRPITFLGKGGKKILRDEIWAGMRFVFPQDHRYYKRHGLYDFPKRSIKRRITEAFFGLLLKLPAFRRAFQAKMKEGMIRPLADVVERC